MRKPLNGLYMTDRDGSEYHQDFKSRAEMIRKQCGECSACALGCNTGKIKAVTFIVTENCNLNCSYCYETHKTKAKMSKEIAKKGVDYLFSEDIKAYFGDDIDGYIIDFFGGEPFMNCEVMDYVATYFKERCFLENKKWLQNSMFAATSNGTLYFTDQAQSFIKKHGSQLGLTITVDGNKTLHDACRVFHNGKGSYDIVEKAVKDWNQKSTSISSTKLTLAPENIDYLYEAVINLCENLNIQHIHANCVFENVWEPHHAQILYDQLIKVADYLLAEKRYKKYFLSFFSENLGAADTEIDKNGCGGNGEMLAIGTDGRLFPCMRFADYALNNQKGKSIGHVDTGININDPWLQELKAVTLRSQSPQKCIDCSISAGCSICTGFHYDEYGTPNKRATNICDMHHARVCANEYFWNKLYALEGLDRTVKCPIENIYRK